MGSLWRTAAVAVLVALAMRISFAIPVLLDPWRAFAGPDSTSYYELGLRLLRGAVHQDVVWPPGYPLFLALVLSAAPAPDPRWVVGVQVALSAIAAGAIVLLAAPVIGQAAARVAGVLYAAAPLPGLWSTKVMSETLASVLTLCGVLGLAVVLAGPWPWRPRLLLAALGGASLSAASLVTGSNRYLGAVVLAVFGVLLIRRGRSQLTSCALPFVAAIVPFVLVLSAWLVHNQRTHGVLSFGTQGAGNLLLNHAAVVLALQQGVSLRDAQWAVVNELADRGLIVRPDRQLHQDADPTWLSEVAQGTWYEPRNAPVLREMALEILWREKGATVLAVTRGTFLLLTGLPPGGRGYIDHFSAPRRTTSDGAARDQAPLGLIATAYDAVLLPISAVLALVGAVVYVLWSRRRQVSDAGWLLIAALVLEIAVYALAPFPRFRVLMLPLEAVLGAVALVCLWRRAAVAFSRRRGSYSGQSA